MQLGELFDELCDPWPDACFLLSREGQVLASNLAGVRLVGISRQQLVGKTILDFVTDPPETIHRYLDVCSRNRQQIPGVLSCRSAGKTVKCRCFGHLVRRADDALPIVFLRCSRAKNESDTFIALNQQLDKLRRVQAQLKDERDHLQAVSDEIRCAKERWELTFDAIDEIVTIHDPEMRIVRANKAAGRFLHVDPEELIGKHCYEVFSGIDGPCPGCPEVITRDSLLPHTATVYHERLAKTVDVSSFPLIEKGELQGFVHIAKDVTAQRMLETQLRQAQKMEALGALAGGIAHDFNNILVPILGYSELALDRVAADDDVASDLKQIVQAAQRAKALVKQILGFARQVEQERWPLEPHLVIKEALKLLRASLPTTIDIRQHIATDCGTILGDPTQIHQVIMNLCTNAYHAMRETGGILGVRLVKFDLAAGDPLVAEVGLVPGPYLRLEVSDTGHGMDQATLDRIFEPFFTTKPKGEGTGMGLAVVRSIIKSYGGYIAATSQPGQGTTFQVYLPRSKDATAAATNLAVQVPLPTGHERILVVDDEKTIANMLEVALQGLGYQVTSVYESPLAWRLFEQNPGAYDLLLTDMTMPAMTGFELAGKVLALRPDMPIILITGFSEIINQEKARAAGIRAYLMKPATTFELAGCVRQVLDGQAIGPM